MSPFSNTALPPIQHRVITAGAAVFALCVSLAMPAHAQDTAVAARTPQQARAEVIADLALWRRAGVDRYEPLHSSYGLETPSYRIAYEEYLRLRASDEFQREVQKALGGH